MFIGHFALGFAAKRAAPRLSLATLFAAAQLADLLWPVLVFAGVEQVRIDPGNTAMTPLDFVSYPYSHSLATLLVWAVLFAFVAAREPSRATPWVLMALVVSHWVLDFVTHRPDLPLYPGGPKLGLGLWNSVAATVAVETALFAAGLWIYLRATRARDAIGRWATAALVVVLLASYAGNTLGGAPPSVDAIVIVGLIGGAILLALAAWADAHRAASRAVARQPTSF
ncbi:MAG TPA: hypothetical protein VKH42_12470 [Vicinamibacterales bacterium]|nr:hypothetical protein [Vicinamibacterales bacterium]